MPIYQAVCLPSSRWMGLLSGAVNHAPFGQKIFHSERTGGSSPGPGASNCQGLVRMGGCHITKTR